MNTSPSQLAKRFIAPLPVLALTLAWAAPCRGLASGYTWNSTGTDFNTAANWSSPGVPGSADHILFNGASTGTNPNLSASATIQQILFGEATSSGWALSGATPLTTLTLTSNGTGTTPGTGAAIYASNTSGTNTISASLVLGAASNQNQRFDVAAGGALELTGPIGGEISTWVKGGNGLLSVSGNNTFKAKISISNGTFLAANNAALGDAANEVVLAGGIFQFGSAFDLSSRTLTFSAGTSRLNTNGFDVTLANSIGNNGAGSIRKDGAGTLTLLGSNLYNGSTILNAGTVAIGSDSAFGSGAVSVTGAATLRTHDATSRTLSNTLSLATNGITTVGAGGDLSFGTLTITHATSNRLSINNTTTSVASLGEDAAGRAFTKMGDGALVVRGNATLSGAVQVDGGLLAVQGTLNATGNIALNGGILGTNGSYTRSLGAANGQHRWLASAAGGFAAVGNGATWGQSGNDLTVNLGGSPTPTTLAFGSSGFLDSGRALLFGARNANGTVIFRNGLDLAGSNQTVAVERSALTGAGVDAAITGVITNGGLTKTGDGVLSLGTDATPIAQAYSGATLVNMGTLLINGSVGNGGITVASGATLGGNFAAGGTTTISSGGTLSVGNTGYGQGTFSALTLNGSTVMEFDAGAGGTGRGALYDAINLTNPDTLAYGGELQLHFAGSVLNETFDLFDFSGLASGDFSTISLYAANTLVGSLTKAGSLWDGAFDLGFGSGVQSFSFNGQAGDLTVVPEPATWGLLGLGLLLAARRRKAA